MQFCAALRATWTVLFWRAIRSSVRDVLAVESINREGKDCCEKYVLTVVFARPFRCEQCDARFFLLSFNNKTNARHRTSNGKSGFKSETGLKLGGDFFPPSR